MAELIPAFKDPCRRIVHAWRAPLACLLFAISFAGLAAERHSDPDGCFSCHGLPGLEYIDPEGVRRTATILQSDYYGSLHGSVPCKDCHRQIERYPHKSVDGFVDCSESCHLNEPSKDKAFTHKPVVEEFKISAHGSGHAPGATKDFHGGNRLKEEQDEQNPSCRRCHSNTPYIKDAQMAAFKEAFHHTETECGTCHQGETWRNQFSGHILRRLVGKNYNKMEANAMCIDCHGDTDAMQKAKIEDPATKEKKPADFRFVHATDSYGKTLHGRLLAVGDEHGADCIDCHAPFGLRHGVQRDEVKTAATHPAHLAETCAQSGCHGYATNALNDGFVKTDLHDVGLLRLDLVPAPLDFGRLDSGYYRAMWVLVPATALFGLASLLWRLRNRAEGTPIPVFGGDLFQRVMLGARGEPAGGGFARFLGRPKDRAAVNVAAAADPAAEGGPPRLTILYASQTGNGEGVALELSERAVVAEFFVELVDLANYNPSAIAMERLVFLITSTHGDGEPPPAAEWLHDYLRQPDAPALENLRFAVFALGDSSYKHFCRAGKDFDAFLEKRGARRLMKRVDADADFEEAAAAWIEDALHAYAGIAGVPYVPKPAAAPKAGSAVGFGKANPYPARVLVNRNLNGEGSAKETRHVEIDLGDSGLVYEAGDALGVYPRNNPVYVEALLAVLQMDGYAEVAAGGETLTLREAFYSRLDITALSRPLLEKYAELVDSAELRELLDEANAERFGAYTWGRHILDLVEDHPPAGAGPQDFVGVLRRLPPRLYSIASSPKAVGNQVHLTMGAVRYHAHGRGREGVCSTYVAGRLGAEERLNVFVQPNKNFRPPADPDSPMIMVGPGTGIAPFRSFVQEREASGAKGRNWLFFGDQRQATDFLYAEEWADKLERGVLTRLDLAFSRDQEAKIYVQTRMVEHGRELYAWLEGGGSFYVCGDASRMASDVHQALLRVIEEHGGKSREQAEEYLQTMADARRYQLDVY